MESDGFTAYLPSGTYPFAFVSGGQLVRDPDPRRSPLGARYSVLTGGEKLPALLAVRRSRLLNADPAAIGAVCG
jgi:hypothetical protein